MTDPRKNKLWLFDKDELERRWREAGERIRILQVFQNPDSFKFGSFSEEEVGVCEELDLEIQQIGRATIYIIFGIDQRDGSRGKCIKYQVNHVSGNNGNQGSGEDRAPDPIPI